MTEREKRLLEMFKNLDRHEQNVIIGKVSELVMNNKKEKIHFFDNVRVIYPIVFVFVF